MSRLIHQDESRFEDNIERCPRYGVPSSFGEVAVYDIATPQFRARVDDAVDCLILGIPEKEIRSEHGVIVLRTAIIRRAGLLKIREARLLAKVS